MVSPPSRSTRTSDSSAVSMRVMRIGRKRGGNSVLVLVAIRLCLQSLFCGRIFGIAVAISIMACYLVVHYVALSFARADLLPPVVAAWTANVIFMGIGVALMLRART